MAPLVRLAAILGTLIPLAAVSRAASTEWIEAAKDGSGFVLVPSARPFAPWGFNYDRDHNFRLLTDYWSAEWETVERDFQEMKQLGANVVRIHLQFANIMDAPGKPNQANLDRLKKLVVLAEDLGLYLDVTGLGNYRAKDVPAWYAAMPEPERWAAQARFWEAVAATCAGRPGVFSYNLMNEPIVAGERRPAGGWVHPSQLNGLQYLEYINLDPGGRERPEIAQQWIRRMAQAIRKHDQRHLLTVGMVLIDIGKPEDAAGFPPAKIAREVDFLSVHIYPETGKLDTAMDTLRRLRVGKPVVIEEIFPLKCSPDDLRAFMDRARSLVNGWISFYWGQTPAELRGSVEPRDQLTRAWLELFRDLRGR